MRYSKNLDRTTKGKRFSGPGMIFLKSAKVFPPFLGIPHSSPVLPLEHEKMLTEYFEAVEFLAKNKSRIRGGGTFQARQGDNWEIAAEREYGDRRFAQHLMAANKGFLSERLPTGSHFARPYIDVTETLGVSSEYLQVKYDISDGKRGFMHKTLSFLWNDLHLTQEEALPLLSLVYEAAKTTIEEAKSPD
jgi:hypothetical protein